MKAYRWMSLHFFSFFMTWGVFLPYWTGWMVHIKGVSVSEASFIMSLGLAARGISTLLFFPYLSGKFSSKALLNGARIGTLLALLCYIPADSFQSLLLVTLVLHVFYPALMPALDSACGVLVQHNELKAYGTSRQWGSAGFVSAGVILSVFTGIFGDQAILWALLLGTLIFACLSFMHAPAVLSKRPETDRARKEGMFALFPHQIFRSGARNRYLTAGGTCILLQLRLSLFAGNRCPRICHRNHYQHRRYRGDYLLCNR